MPADKPRAEAEAWAKELLRKSPTALRFLKYSFNADTAHVGGRLEHLRPRDRRGRLLPPIDDLDATILQLLVQDLDVGGIEIEELERLLEVGAVDDPRPVRPLQEDLKLLVLADDRALVSHSMSEAISARRG